MTFDEELDYWYERGIYNKEEWIDYWWNRRAHALNQIEMLKTLVEKCSERIDRVK